jgi:hypothetical protein
VMPAGNAQRACAGTRLTAMFFPFLSVCAR